MFGPAKSNALGAKGPRLDSITRNVGVGAHSELAAKLVGGELLGNIDGAKRVELLEGGVISGDVKAGSLTVAAGSRMRGQVEFGWDAEGRSTTSTKGYGTGS